MSNGIKNNNNAIDTKIKEKNGKFKLEEIKDISEFPPSIPKPYRESLNKAKETIINKLKGTDHESVYHAHFNMSLDMMCVSFGNGYLIMVNDYFTKILEYEKGELEGKPVLDFIHPDYINSTIDAQASLNNDIKLSYFENRWRKKWGIYTIRMVM